MKVAKFFLYIKIYWKITIQSEIVFLHVFIDIVNFMLSLLL